MLAALPPQGQWNRDAYLWLADYTSRRSELTDGYTEMLPIPTAAHRSVLASLSLEHDTCVEHGGFGHGTQATSVLLNGFAAPVDAVSDAV